MRILSNAFTYCFTSLSYYLPRRIPFQPMNYKDALNVTINDKLTKAKLIAISNTLQDHCLVDELTVIPMSKYYTDIRTRWQTHLDETRLLIKDVVSIGKQARVIFDQAYARAFD